MDPIRELLDQFADAVARRVIEYMRAEAAKSETVYLTPTQMAARNNVSPKTLANLRSAKRGPPFVKIGGQVRYPVSGESS